MHRALKAITVFLFAAIVLAAAVPVHAAGPFEPAQDVWLALWQPLAEWLGISGIDPEVPRSPRNAVGAEGAGVDPNGLTEPGAGEKEGGYVTPWGPSETTEGGGAIDPNGDTGGSEAGGRIDPNG